MKFTHCSKVIKYTDITVGYGVIWGAISAFWWTAGAVRNYNLRCPNQLQRGRCAASVDIADRTTGIFPPVPSPRRHMRLAFCDQNNGVRSKFNRFSSKFPIYLSTRICAVVFCYTDRNGLYKAVRAGCYIVRRHQNVGFKREVVATLSITYLLYTMVV